MMLRVIRELKVDDLTHTVAMHLMLEWSAVAYPITPSCVDDVKAVGFGAYSSEYHGLNGRMPEEVPLLEQHRRTSRYVDVENVETKLGEHEFTVMRPVHWAVRNNLNLVPVKGLSELKPRHSRVCRFPCQCLGYVLPHPATHKFKEGRYFNGL